MATRENSLSENTAGCFYLIIKRKQLPSLEVFIIELSSSAYHSKRSKRKIFERTITLMDRTLIIVLPLTKGKKKILVYMFCF